LLLTQPYSPSLKTSNNATDSPESRAGS
jgi:hypothetical protein